MQPKNRYRLLLLLGGALSACAGRGAVRDVGAGPDPCPPPAPSPAGHFAVFTASKDLATRTDLYLARLDGSEVLRLNGPVPRGGVAAFLVSPDRSQVAYLADQDTQGVLELYVAQAGGDVFAFSTP
jgi:hypothetical protein